MKFQQMNQGKVKNAKNFSNIRCHDNTYIKPLPKIIRARHMKLTPAHANESQKRLATDGNLEIDP